MTEAQYALHTYSTFLWNVKIYSYLISMIRYRVNILNSKAPAGNVTLQVLFNCPVKKMKKASLILSRFYG